MTTIQPASSKPSTSVSFLGLKCHHKLISASRQAREELLGMLRRICGNLADKIRSISRVDGYLSFGGLRFGPYRSLLYYRLCS
jgi:hypothetical protein